MKTKSQLRIGLILVILSIGVLGIKAQDAFDHTFYSIYMDVASRDVREAHRLADSLYGASTTDLQRIRSLMLIGDMHHRMAQRDSSIHYAEQAGKLAERQKNFEWQARIYGVLSTQLREMGLVSRGKAYLAKGLDAIDRVENAHMAAQYRAMCYQELGFYALEQNDPETGLVNFRRADSIFSEQPESTVLAFAQAQNHERLGLCYLELGRDDSAAFHYEQALALEPSKPEAESPVRGFIYNGLGVLHLRAGEYELAYSQLTRAEQVAEASGFPALEIAVYKAFARYYRLLGDTESYMAYNDRFVEADRVYSERHKQYVDHAFVDAQARLASLSESKTMQVALFGCSLLAVAAAVLWYVNRQRRLRKRFKALIRKLREAPATPIDVSGESVILKRPGAGKQPLEAQERGKEVMPEKTKEQLLAKLAEFEATSGFRNKNMSIALLASKLKTNTKYLSYVINNDKGADFNSYINALRIGYIIHKMREDEQYLNYKISYLAEESGFSSHSQFATVFRSVTGLAPSTFIGLLKKHGERAELA